MNNTPLLSIGIIFKNEERCIERCLKSLQPLRDAVPCELVMADTGATDKSREIAERYADLVIDFPWVDDFSAARNAVMDRCGGRWHLFIDCDEWLDGEISELVRFLQRPDVPELAFVVVRNYLSSDGGQYSDSQALRLAQTSKERRFVGTIHESWVFQEPAERLVHTVLHHDGYLHASREAADQKLRRNMRLLRRELAKDPQNLRTLNECIDSGRLEPEYPEYLRRAVTLVQQQAGQWKVYGGCILRSAVRAARELELPELWGWIDYAEKHLADSPFIQIDLQYTAFEAACDTEDWARAARHGLTYRQGLRQLREGGFGPSGADELARGSLRFASEENERSLTIGLANAHLQAGQPEQAAAALAGLDAARLSARQICNAIVVLGELHAGSGLDVSGLLTRFYTQLEHMPDGEARQARLAAFDQITAAAFAAEYRQEEAARKDFCRPAYTLFAALADRCEAGRGAAILMSADPGAMRELLARVEDWQALPIEALEHALLAGVAFPLTERPLPIEVLDGLAARLTRGENLARQMTLALPEKGGDYPDLQSVCWALALALAAVRGFDWALRGEEPPEQPRPEQDAADGQRGDTAETGLALLRAFARVEGIALPLLYAPALLSEQNAALLPPMHRWGFYCARAFAALDAGQPQEYLAVLRRGLAACPGQKETVQFLLGRFQADTQADAKPETRPNPSPELLALAEKVRTILTAYGPDHPAAKAIRESDAYRQVAWLIEETPGIPVQ